MTTKLYQLETVSCPSCIAKIEKMLQKTQGVHSSEVLFNSSRVRVSFDEREIESERIRSLIEKLGYKVIGEK
ncbi:heavy-metal-associated domain-containing protein [Paenibacillus lentus]|uniref:heavy-metal-associated domain-containing protein n=1 Tax=Paenibacillus lentus TaxID=1338368 RepID=UPI00365EF6BC